MKTFKAVIASSESKQEFNFECYDNTEPIEIGDHYIFFFGDIVDVQICDTDSIKAEVNQHNRPKNHDNIDLVHGFWRNCYKIKTTDFDLTSSNN